MLLLLWIPVVTVAYPESRTELREVAAIFSAHLVMNLGGVLKRLGTAKQATVWIKVKTLVTIHIVISSVYIQ